MSVVAITGVLLLLYAHRGKRRDDLNLKYFSQAEFGAYWPMMNIGLLKKLDAFRAALGYPVAISPAAGAIGRPIIGSDGQLGEAESSAEKSWHNYLLHGEIMAIDVMPVPPGGATPAERQRWVDVARQVGFTGIGVYPHWRPRPGLHLDVRTDRTPDNPATWAGVRNDQGKQVYVGIQQGVLA
ncbi:hypothetical protein S7S_09345 [Isoalcanivorax pacificus W11-5]|uniref:Peptidase M15A C-terminal domain-containing protein n=1 Tax=Isoalcanivorax pacificus W11-5 TaxID=391936 RepID=A0A0B4XMA2_9GAMM|nr:hypothetical protein [Isoalcanivorax pacificus]AJD48281.1 hypothetical protein S7S_09345 [Isoalcanivorax pacificus W11-5]